MAPLLFTHLFSCKCLCPDGDISGNFRNLLIIYDFHRGNWLKGGEVKASYRLSYEYGPHLSWKGEGGEGLLAAVKWMKILWRRIGGIRRLLVKQR